MEDEARFYKHTYSSRGKFSEPFINTSDDAKLTPWHQVPMLPTYNDVYNLSPQDPGIIRDRSSAGWPRPVIPITPIQKKGKIRKGHLDNLKNEYNAQTLAGMKTGGGSILEFIRKQKEGVKATNREQQMRDSHRNKEIEWDEAILRSNEMLKKAKLKGMTISRELNTQEIDEECSEYIKRKHLTLGSTMGGDNTQSNITGSFFDATAKSSMFRGKSTLLSTSGNRNTENTDFDFKVPATEHTFMRSTHFPKANEKRFAKMYTNILFKTPDDETRLFEAAIYDDHYVVRGLLELLPNAVNIVDKNGNSALSIAALYGSVITVELLIYAGANLDHRNNFGMSPLDLAFVRKHTDVAAFLVISGASASFDHCSPKMRVAMISATQKLEMRKKIGALFEAVDANDVDAVKTLVNVEGVDVNSTDPHASVDDPYTPLHIALIRNQEPNVEILTFLLEKGADICAMDCEGDTALHVACGRGASGDCGDCDALITCISSLLEKEKMSMDQLPPNRLGRTALFHACMSGNLRIVTLLFDTLPVLANRHELERKDVHGHTCLYYASAVNAKDVCAYLVEQGTAIGLPITAV